MNKSHISYCGPASIVPGVENYATAQLSGGIYDQNRHLISETLRDHDFFLHDPPKTLSPSFEPDEIIAQAIFAGHWFFHFGHFMLETLPMIGLAAQLPKDLPILFFPVGFHLLGRREFHSAQLELSMQLGVDLKRVRFINRPIRVARLSVLSKPYKLNSQYSPAAVASFQDSLQRASTDIIPTQKGIYLTRRGLVPSKDRFCINEYQLERYYRAKGYTIVAPEQLTVSKQLQTLASSPAVVALDGSALYLTAACKNANIKCFACRDIISIKLFVNACGHSYEQTTVNEEAAGLYRVSADNVIELEGKYFDSELWKECYCADEEEGEFSLRQAALDLSVGSFRDVRTRLIPRLKELGTRASILIAMSWTEHDDPVEARQFLSQAFVEAPFCWDVARVWLIFMLRIGEIDEAERVLRLPQFGVDSEWLDFARKVEEHGNRCLLSDDAALALLEKFPSNVAIYHFLAHRMRMNGHPDLAADILCSGRLSTGLFWID